MMHPANLMRDRSLGNAPTGLLLRFNSLLMGSITFVVRILFQCAFGYAFQWPLSSDSAMLAPRISLGPSTRIPTTTSRALFLYWAPHLIKK